MGFSPSIMSGVIGVADGLATVGTGYAIYLLYVVGKIHHYPNYVSALAIQTALVLTTFYFAKLYDSKTICRLTHQVKNILAISAATFLALVVVSFALKISDQFSRVWFFSWVISATFLICVARTVFYIGVRKSARAGRLTRNIAIVGAGEQGRKLLEHLDWIHEPWIRIVGIFDDRVDRFGPTVMGQPILGTLDDLIGFAREHRIDDIIITLPWSADERLFGIIAKLMELPVRVSLGSDLIGFRYPRGSSGFIGGVPILEVVGKPLEGWKFVVKTLEDRIFAAITLILIAPLMLVISVAIKLDSKGPVLFRQKRYGFNNHLIDVYKFRTMYHDKQDDNAEKLTTRDDPRVTRVGAFLRRTSLDELPQFFNVLKGEMSVVGPRPHPIKAKAAGRLYDEVIQRYATRHRVKPGITGWAQVNGWRGETDTEEKIMKRVEHDLYYIDHWSLLFDFRIILQTVWSGFRGPGAY